jgi:glutathione S-transferase
MSPFTLYIGDKNYSSWSLRAWLVMKHVGKPFDEVVIPLGEPGMRTAAIAPYSPSGRVPALRHGDVTIWDSLAIAEYVAEVFPEAGLWPADRVARAIARAVSAEMHSGFAAMRSAMPMNLRRAPAPLALGPDVAGDVDRVLAIWRECRQRHGHSGPFLFGRFSVADAMFAPVVTRLRTYGAPVDEDAARYMDAVVALPAMKEWTEAARAEGHVIASYEKVGK